MIHRVAVHGGSSLDDHVARFARFLGRAIAKDTRLTLVTGGFKDRVSGAGADADPTEAGPTSPTARSSRARGNPSDVVLVDITEFNLNVMYELGHVHAKSVAPLLYQRVAIDVDPAAIPFY